MKEVFDTTTMTFARREPNVVKKVAVQKLNTAIRTILCSKELSGFLSCFQNLEDIEIVECETARPKESLAYTDGVKIRINDCFLYGLTNESVCFVLLHEMLHNVLLHMERSKRIPNIDYQLWNMVCDAFINEIVSKYFQFNDCNGNYKIIYPKFFEKYLKNKNIMNYTEEQVYEMLLQNAVQVSYFDMFSYGAESDKEQNSGSCGSQSWENVVEKWKNTAPSVLEKIAEKLAGTGTSDYLRKFLVKVKSCDWKKILFDFLVHKNYRKDYSRFSKRHSYLNGSVIYPKTIEINKQVLVIARDNSGSINDKTFNDFVNYLASLVKTIKIKKIYMIEFTDKVNEVYTLDENLKGLTNLFERKYTGGTSFVPVFNKVDEISKNEKISGVIVLTDLFGDFPSKAPCYPVLWMVDKDSEHINVPFGRMAIMK